MSAIVETHQLSKRFDPPRGWRQWLRRTSAETTVPAVVDVSLAVEQGELFGLLGPNGAGKTTLVKMLCTLILPSGGSASVAGKPLSAGQAIRSKVGLVVTDERSFYWRLSARRNLTFFAAMHGLHGRDQAQRVEQVLGWVDLADVADRRFSDFSSGMKQRLAIARGLLHQPQILFLDEPTRSLDPTATQQLHDLVLRLMADHAMTVFLITHDLAEAEKLCNRVAVMHRGRVQTVGSPEALRQQLQPTRRYTLDTTSLSAEALQQLRQLAPDVVSAEVANGTRLTFRAGERDARLTAVVDALRASDLPIHAIIGLPPSLEEVFAHFTHDPQA